jgi:hypothetical protein
MENALFRGNREPSLDQVLSEPIVQMMMRRDGIDETSIRRLMQKAAGATKPANAPTPAFVPPKHSRIQAESESPQASVGILAQAPTAPAWPRVFPSL